MLNLLNQYFKSSILYVLRTKKTWFWRIKRKNENNASPNREANKKIEVVKKNQIEI